MSFNSILISRPNASKARLPALYADFRPLKQNNPEGYAANIQVWQSALSHAIYQNIFQNESILVLDITSQFLSDISLPPYGRPLGIGCVIVCSFLGEVDFRKRVWGNGSGFLWRTFWVRVLVFMRRVGVLRGLLGGCGGSWLSILRGMTTSCLQDGTSYKRIWRYLSHANHSTDYPLSVIAVTLYRGWR